MAALQARNRNAAQNGKTASAPCRSRDAGDGNDDTETLRRRVEELELENALMREVVEVVKKDPGADLGSARKVAHFGSWPSMER